MELPNKFLDHILNILKWVLGVRESVGWGKCGFRPRGVEETDGTGQETWDREWMFDFNG